jgi:serine/threonine protein kinase
MRLTPGDRLGPYEIRAPIGAGGMGEVYKARDTRLDRIVAIKIAHEKFTERFEREARVIAALNHPTSVRCMTLVRTTWSWSSSTARR